MPCVARQESEGTILDVKFSAVELRLALCVCELGGGSFLLQNQVCAEHWTLAQNTAQL